MFQDLCTSCFKFLLVFPTVEEMEESLLNHEELKTWFYDIKKWTSSDLCDARKVWIDIYGVPPHGWSWENFKKIAELWGGGFNLLRKTHTPH